MGRKEREEKRQEMTWKGKGDREEKEDGNRQTGFCCCCCCFALQRAEEHPIIGLRGQKSD